MATFRPWVAVQFVYFAAVWYWNCSRKPSLLPAATPPNYKLVFSEDFDRLDLGSDSQWCEGVWFSKKHAPLDHFSLNQGQLSLIWTRGQGSDDTSISTLCRNGRHYSAWRYGYFEARMKWTPQAGAWPAFWLIPVQAAREPAPSESGEIDIFEGQGSEPHTFFGTVHRWRGSYHLASNSPHNHYALPNSADFSQFHTYGLLWAPGRVTWYFDGVPLHSEPTYSVFDEQDFFIVLGMQEGHDWKPGDLNGVRAERLTLTVDWVRVWQAPSR